MRIGKKLILSYTLLAILAFVIAGFILRASVEYLYMENIRGQLTSKANTTAVAINELNSGRFDGAHMQPLANKLGASMEARVTLVKPDGTVIADSSIDPKTMANHADRPEVRQALEGKSGSSQRFSETTGQEMLYVAVPYKTDGQVLGIIRISLPFTEIKTAINSFSLVMLAIAIGAIITVVLISYLISRSLTTPLKRMMAMAERMANDDLEQRLPVGGSDEINELSKSLNNLAGKLKDRIDELRLEKAKIELILDNMVDGVLLLDREDNIVLTNPAAEQIFQVKAADTIGNPVIHSIKSYELDQAIQDSTASGKEVVDEIELQAPFRQLRIRVLPIADTVGEIQTLVIIRNITRQKQIERLRKDFIANVSHELKTPLTGLKLLSDTLLRSIETDPSSSKVFIKRLDSELSKLISMVRKLIDLSKIETPQKMMEKLPVSLGELANEVGSSFSQLASNKGLTLSVNAPQDLPFILGDKDQLLTLIRNLVDNAIRYTPLGGKIDVEVQENGTHIDLIVSDNGIGMAKREVPRIFERFYRVDKARSRETGGTGLGLSIVKHIAENHDGLIKVNSSLGIGSTFTVSFPVDSSADKNIAGI